MLFKDLHWCRRPYSLRVGAMPGFGAHGSIGDRNYA